MAEAEESAFEGKGARLMAIVSELAKEAIWRPPKSGTLSSRASRPLPLTSLSLSLEPLHSPLRRCLSLVCSQSAATRRRTLLDIAPSAPDETNEPN